MNATPVGLIFCPRVYIVHGLMNAEWGFPSDAEGIITVGGTHYDGTGIFNRA